MKFEIKKLLSMSGAKPLLKASDSHEALPFDKPTSKVALGRGVALLVLSIPVIALAPWAGGADDTGATGALGMDSRTIAPIPVSTPPQHGEPATASAATGAPANSANAPTLLASAEGHAAFPWSDSAGMGPLMADARGSAGTEAVGNRRFGAAGNSQPRASGSGAIPTHALGWPGSPGFLSSMPLGGGPRAGGGTPAASGSPGSVPSGSLPRANPSNAGIPPDSDGSPPQDATNGGEGPIASNPPVPVVDVEKIVELQDGPAVSELLPPPPSFGGDPLPEDKSLFGPEETAASDPAIVAAAVVPTPGTGWLMVLAFPLLLFFRGPGVSRRA